MSENLFFCISRQRYIWIFRAYVNRTIELEDGSKITTLEKHVMRYQQLFASLAIRKKLSKERYIWIFRHESSISLSKHIKESFLF